jgi:hypothetical protein
MSIQIKRRGRPRKNPISPPVDRRPDGEVLEELKDRFEILKLLTRGAVSGDVRSTVVTGAPGVGKSYTVYQILERYSNRHEVVKVAVSAVNLYKLAYDHRQPGEVVVLDDADGIFNDEDALNILKALCESTPERRVSWMKESAALKEDEVPKSFTFNGSFIFISNLDFQHYVDMGSNRMAPHFSALMSRSLYLDLKLHTRQAVSLWVRHVATEGMLFAREGISEEMGDRILGFLDRNRESLREYSLRTVMKAGSLSRSHPNDWERMARVLLCRS